MNIEEYAGIPNNKLAEAIEIMSIGANSISSVCIGLFSADFMTNWEYWRRVPDDDAFSQAREEINKRFGLDPEKEYIAYECWVMWHSAMRARQLLFGY